VESVTDEFAAAGYVAIAPDLLSGMGPNGGRTKDIPANGVGAAIGKLPPDQITADLNAVADYVQKLPACNGKVCVVRLLVGGGQSFRFAPTVRICRPHSCATAPAPPGSHPQHHGPVYGFYAGADERVDASIPPPRPR